MILWDASPVAFSLGPVAVRWYGIVYALGFLLAYWVLLHAAKRKAIRNLDERAAEDYLLWLMAGSIIAARVFYVAVYNPGYYLVHPLEIPAVWHGGLSIHGGLLGAIAATAWFCRRRGIQFYAIADLLVAPLALALVFGRMANYANGELWGRITDVPWCVEFPGADGCRHPSQLYEALYSMALFMALLAMQGSRSLRDRAQGTLFWTFVTAYGALRFIVTFWREYDPTDPALLSLSIGQWLSLAMVIAGIVWFVRSTGANARHK